MKKKSVVQYYDWLSLFRFNKEYWKGNTVNATNKCKGAIIRLRTLIIRSILPAIIIAGCSTTKLTVETIKGQNPQIDLKPITYATFWEAMENLDFTYTKNHKLSKEHLKFAESLSLIVDGKIDSAETALFNLFRSTNDSLLKKHMKSIIAELLFSQSKWNDILQFHPDSGVDEDEGLMQLATVFNKYPKEEYAFSPQLTNIPITLGASGSPIVEVEVNGHKKKFYLDTGAGITTVASDVAEECNISHNNSDTLKAGTGTNKMVDLVPAVIDELKIGDVVIRNHPASIIKKEDLEFTILGLIRLMKVDGIIGWNAIQNMNIEINYKNKYITITKPSRNEKTNGNFFWLGYPIVRLHTQEGTELNFGFDTGANSTSIRENIFKKIVVEKTEKEKNIIGGAGGWESYEATKTPKLILVIDSCRVNFENIKTGLIESATFLKLDGVLGSDVAQNAVLKLDFQNRSAMLILLK